MKRYIWFATAIAFIVLSSSPGAQGRGQGRGGGAPEPIDWNAKMPWGALEKAVQAQWGSLPRTAQKTDPFKIFDNLYYVGVQHVAAYLVPTSEGLILIDATYADTADMVLDSIRKAGFDPANIKYIVITHSHFDHVAGIGRVKQVAPNARIIASAADWDEIEKQHASNQPQRFGPSFARDMVAADGQLLKLGDSTLKLHHAPGHSAGALALELEARDGAKKYRLISPCVGLFNVPASMTQTYITSMERVKQMGPWDGVFASHAFLTPRDPYISPRDFLLGPDVAKAGKRPHPAIQGAVVINEWFDQILKVAREKLASEQKPATN
jgi:metallo-beta-lactamase class B